MARCRCHPPRVAYAIASEAASEAGLDSRAGAKPAFCDRRVTEEGPGAASNARWAVEPSFQLLFIRKTISRLSLVGTNQHEDDPCCAAAPEQTKEGKTPVFGRTNSEHATIGSICLGRFSDPSSHSI